MDLPQAASGIRRHGRSREGGRTRQDVNNTQSRLGKASVHVVANAEEVWERIGQKGQNRQLSNELLPKYNDLVF